MICLDIETNVDYKGNGIKGYEGLKNKVDTAEECRSLCKIHDECVGWSWSTPEKSWGARTCWLKNKMVLSGKKNHVVTGAKECVLEGTAKFLNYKLVQNFP